MTKTYVIWLTKRRKMVIESTSFTNCMAEIAAECIFENEIMRIYCVDDDRSLVFYNNISEGKKNG